MKYVLIFLLIIVLAVFCGAGLAIAGWLSARPSTELAVPPTLDPNLLPTPTMAAAPVDDQNTNPPVQPPTNGNLGGGVFNGTFSGILYGSAGSSAPVTLELAQAGNEVTGVMSIGPGLVIDGGNCGIQEVPPGTQTANGRIDPADPNHLDAGAVFQVQGLTITISLAADLSADGQALTTQALIDLPFICGPDPVLNGNFSRQ